MHRALRLARAVAGSTSPNPPVGAVVVSGGQVVGQGATQPPGGPHAEVVALRAAGPAARGATLYVTLEPCPTVGRTPPCTSAILEAGIAEVRFASYDPNPAVSGRGEEALRAAGVRTVHEASFEEAAWDLIEAHAKYSRTGRPFVIAKYACSLDGKIAARDGSATWITSPEAREASHRLRAQVDAIMVGGTTILADDSQLTARPGGRLAPRQPIRVVFDSIAATPSDARVIHGPGRCLIAVGRDAREEDVARLRAAGAEVMRFSSPGRRVSLAGLLDYLASQGCISILAEGGGTLLGALFDGGFVDKVMAFIAPAIIGGADAPTAVGGEGAANIAGALRLSDVSVRRAGTDLIVTGYTQPRHVLMGAAARVAVAG